VCCMSKTNLATQNYILQNFQERNSNIMPFFVTSYFKHIIQFFEKEVFIDFFSSLNSIKDWRLLSTDSFKVSWTFFMTLYNGIFMNHCALILFHRVCRKERNLSCHTGSSKESSWTFANCVTPCSDDDNWLFSITEEAIAASQKIHHRNLNKALIYTISLKAYSILLGQSNVLVVICLMASHFLCWALGK